MQDFKISIIIPTYNREKYLQECINSIIETKDNNLEIIIVDNASQDDTKKILLKYKKDKRFKLIFNDQNYERSYSRNIGINNSTGEFITFLDSDDRLKKNIFKEFRAFYIKNKNYNIYYSNFEIYSQKFETFKINKKISNFCTLNKLSKGNYLSNICVFFNSNIIGKIYYDENPNIIGIEDYDFNLRIINKFGNAKLFSRKSLGIVTDHSHRSVNLDSINQAEKRFVFFKNKLFSNADYINFNLNIKYKILSTASLYVSLICLRNKKRYKCIMYGYIAIINNLQILMDRRFYYIFIRLLFTV